MYYFTHIKVFLMSNLGMLPALWHRTLGKLKKVIYGGDGGINNAMQPYYRTSYTYLFDNECCLYGNGLFINFVEEFGLADTTVWNDRRERLFTDKSNYDKYVSVFKSVTGFKFILDDLIASNPHNKKLTALLDPNHKLYKRIQEYEDTLGLKDKIDLTVLN